MKLSWSDQEIEVRELGQGPTVLLVHGYPLDGAMWSPVARRLSGQLRIIKPDLPGRPDNPALPGGSIDSYADFLQAIVESADRPLGLAGFSMGGYVALALAKRRLEGIQALAFVDTRAVADDSSTRAARDEAIRTLTEKGVEPIAEAMLPRLLSPDSLTRKELVERVRRIILRQRPETLVSDLKAMRDRPDSTAFLKEIRVPTLVLVGERDVISPPTECQAMADAMPEARMVRIPSAGHLTPMESPATVAMALSHFFTPALSA